MHLLPHFFCFFDVFINFRIDFLDVIFKKNVGAISSRPADGEVEDPDHVLRLVGVAARFLTLIEARLS